MKARPAHQCGFNKIVRHDAARHAATAFDVCQSAMLHKGSHANNRVMAPIMRLAHLPVLHPQCEQAPGHTGSKLLRPCVQRDMANRLGRGLNNASAGVGLHQLDHGHQAVAAHDAIGIEHHHIGIVFAPAAAKVGHIAGFAVGAAAAQAVINLDLRLVGQCSQLTAQIFPSGTFGLLQSWIIAVGQHKHVKRPHVTGRCHRFTGSPQAGKNRAYIFIADRHDDRGTQGFIQRVVRHIFGR